jgi:hypothetical protein
MTVYTDPKKKKLIDFILADYLNLDHLHAEQYTKVVHFLLAENEVPHKTYVGSILWRGLTYTPHCWIVAGELIIDFKLRSRTGSKTLPSGVFHMWDPKAPRYVGFNYPMHVTQETFDLLLSPAYAGPEGKGFGLAAAGHQ